MTLYIGSIFLLPQARGDARPAMVTMAYTGILRQKGGVSPTVRKLEITSLGISSLGR